MKKDIEEYLSKSNLKNIEIFYKKFRTSNNKNIFPYLGKSHKSYTLIKKKIEPIETIPGKPFKIHLKSLKSIKDKILLNIKTKMRQKFINNSKLYINCSPISNKLKSFNNNTTSIYIETEKINNNFDLNSFDYEKEFFSDNIYMNMRYNEYEIFKSKKVYDDLIKEKIEILKNEKNENKEVKFEKKFIYGKEEKEINLTFDSLQIIFTDMSLPQNLENKKIKINLPFSLLPIFYYKGIKAFIKFLCEVIKIENNFEKIIFDQDKIMDALNDLKEYRIKEEDLDDSYASEESDYYRSEKPIELKPMILKKNLDFLKFNNFIFFWITNTKTFITTITLPCVHLNINENKIVINDFINYELLFYLYKKKFVNWEFYIIKYLSSYSKFRNIFQHIDSHSKAFNKTIFLKEPKTMMNTFAKENLINIYTDQNNNNQIIIFKSFHVKATLSDVNYFQEKTYNIYFNFFHYVKLYEIAKYSSKILFLVKFMKLNKDMHTLSFNFTAYDEFNIRSWMSNIKKFSDESLNNNSQNEELYREFDIYTKKIKVEFIRPKWTIMKLENKREVVKSWEIGNELEKELVDSIVDSGSDSWTKLLNECLKKLNEPVPILPDVTKKKIKKKLSKKNMVIDESNKKLKKRISKISK